MASRAFPFAEKDLFTPNFTRSCLSPVKTASYRIELRRRRKIQHILELRHVAHTNSIQNDHALLHSVNGITVEVRRALLEFGKVFDRSKTALGTMNLLVEHAPQAGSIQTKPPFLWTYVGSQVELSSGMSIHVAIEARNA